MLSHQQQQKQIGALLKKPENTLCADCSSKSPCWASLDFGVFVCMNCSGAHRALGQSVTRTKSTKLDTWNKDWLWHMQLNNKIINQYYQAKKSFIFNRKPNPSSSLTEIQKFVYDKYVRKLFAQQGQNDPITNLKNGKPPIKRIQNQKIQKEQPQKKIQKQLNQINVKLPQKKTTNILDSASDQSNKGQSTQYQKNKQQLNLFQSEPNNNNNNNNNITKNNNVNVTNIYKKQHFNSFSGKGAQHSSTGHASFDTVFGHNSHENNNNNNKISFDQFKNITTPYSINLSPDYYGYHNNQHNQYPNIFSAGRAPPHHPPHYPNLPVNTPLNIHNNNLNSNITNFNLTTDKSSKPVHTSSKQVNINNHIKLDINDFIKKQEPAKQSHKSWVDQWK